MSQSSSKDGNVYDRIFKENAQYIFMPLIEMELELSIQSYKPLPEKFAKTLEREVDFLYEITTREGTKQILHLEFQTKNDKTMLYRIQEYHALIYRKYQLHIHHVVIYLGKAKVNMPTALPENAIYRGFQLISLNALDSSVLLASQVPEVLLLAMLSKYEEEQIEALLRLILLRLKQLNQNEADLNKYLNQLLILSRLRNLEDTFSKILDDMAVISYDIKKDSLYKKGKLEGEQVGMEKGLEQGIKALLKTKVYSADEIAVEMGVSIEFVHEVKAKLEAKE